MMSWLKILFISRYIHRRMIAWVLFALIAAHVSAGETLPAKYSGLAKEYASCRSAEILSVSECGPQASRCYCKQSLKSCRATFQEAISVLSASSRNGTWLLFVTTDRHGQLVPVRVTADDESQTLTKYICEIKQQVDANLPTRPSLFYKYLEAEHWLVEQDACAEMLAMSFDELSRFAASLPVSEIVKRLHDAKEFSWAQSRIYILMLAHSRGDTHYKSKTLSQIMVESLSDEWPGQAENLDAILSALLICDRRAGESRIRSILSSQYHLPEIHKKALRAVSFGIATGKISRNEFFDDIRPRFSGLYDAYPEVISLAHVCGVSLTADEVAQMATHSKIPGESLEESLCHRSIMEYYWTRDAAWQSDFMRLVSAEDKVRAATLRRRRNLQRTPGRLLHAALEDAIHRPESGVACSLGAATGK